MFSRERLIINSTRSGSWQIYAVRPDGSDFTALTHYPTGGRIDDVAADGTRVVFRRWEGSGRSTATEYSLSLPSRTVAPLDTNPPGSRVRLSPTGTRIAFGGNDGGVYLADWDGSNAVPIGGPPSCPEPPIHCNHTRYGFAGFSPDGRHYAVGFSSEDGPTGGFYIGSVHARAGQRARAGAANRSETVDSFGEFSPGSKSYIFIQEELAQSPPAVYAANIGRGRPVRLTPEGRYVVWASYLPGGRRVVDLENNAVHPNRPFRYFVENVDGSGRRPIHGDLFRQGFFVPSQVSQSGKLVVKTHGVQPRGTAVDVFDRDGRHRVVVTRSRGKNIPFWTVAPPGAGP
jgi:hypothetical protein